MSSRTSRLISKTVTNKSDSLIMNMVYWMFILCIMLFIFRYIILIVFGHDLFDFDQNMNRFAYVIIITVSFFWIMSHMSMDGFDKLGTNYNRKYSAQQLNKIERDNATYAKEQEIRKIKQEEKRLFKAGGLDTNST